MKNWEAQNIAEKLTGCIGGNALIVQAMFEALVKVAENWGDPKGAAEHEMLVRDTIAKARAVLNPKLYREVRK